MNRSDLKDYAPQARRDFIRAMKDRAAFYGLTASKVDPVVERGDAVVIAGREHPRAVGRKRKALEERIRRNGFDQTMEAMAYTWFNRLVAIRFMELHGYLDHGYRVLSHPDGKPTPEILEHADAEQVNLPGLKRDRIIDLKQAGNKDSELFRLLLTAQCNALNAAMPFLFERIDDETELLLPDNLLHSDSLIRKLVNEINEEDWREVEIIGWLYQFYISEKKAKVIGKVVASEDIPAATQLFTPNWIVKYLVQNTLGRQWLATYPKSALRQKMEYYIEPAEQTQEVQDELRAITPASLNPEELTLLDPACGSGHILVEAYDLFKLIYEERGYRAKEIPALILHKNLFGLEIDDRAAQLAAFALVMKARADDRRIFGNDVKPNVMAFVESKGLDATSITNALNAPIDKDKAPKEYLFEEIEDAETPLLSRKVLAEKGHVSQADIASLLVLFQSAKSFGSLIQVPQNLSENLPEIKHRVCEVLKHGDLMQTSARDIEPLLRQAEMLARRYDAVVANPPYMGRKYYCNALKTFVDKNFLPAKGDLYGAFIIRNFKFADVGGQVGMITIPNWMFLSTYDKLRSSLLSEAAIVSLVHNGRGVWGADFGSCSFVLRRAANLKEYVASFKRLFSKQGEVRSNEDLKTAFHSNSLFLRPSSFFDGLPGKPIAYWLSDLMHQAFSKGVPLSEIAPARQGLATADNHRFVRGWQEVEVSKFARGCTSRAEAISKSVRWFPYNKGGDFRKWYGNQEFCIDWENDGDRIRNFKDENGKVRSAIRNPEYYFVEAISWSDITSSTTAFRYFPPGFVYDVTGMSAFPPSEAVMRRVLGFCNSIVASGLTRALNPTVHFQIGNYQSLPFIDVSDEEESFEHIAELINLSKSDWDSYETSWDFGELPILRPNLCLSTIESTYGVLQNEWRARILRMQCLEEANNRLFIKSYALDDELTPAVPLSEVTLMCNPRYRYGGELSDGEREDRLRCDTLREVVSYAIGCMMGRYNLGELALIYALSGGNGFDLGRYKKFAVDDDGILPLLDTDWGIRDDAANRVAEFIGIAWPKEHLEENLKFVADSLGPTNGEQPRDTIRRYLAVGFYKHHLAMYKKRPIYWLFSSGKQRAFQCLVYLHRYHEGTLARMRTEYVIPLQGQIAARIDQLEGDKVKATSTSHRKKLQKEQDDLKKQQAELAFFEEKLKHAADQKIALDLDEGVKVNYCKFGDLVADAKAITGGKDDE